MECMGLPAALLHSNAAHGRRAPRQLPPTHSTHSCHIVPLPKTITSTHHPTSFPHTLSNTSTDTNNTRAQTKPQQVWATPHKWGTGSRSGAEPASL
eukprot:12883132-Prorocentrum_lima.AAC.1